VFLPVRLRTWATAALSMRRLAATAMHFLAGCALHTGRGLLPLCLHVWGRLHVRRRLHARLLPRLFHVSLWSRAGLAAARVEVTGHR